jgi:antitoxin YefM
MSAKRPSKKKVYSKTVRIKKDSVVISREEYEGLKETASLLSNPKNARRLRSALAQAKAGKLKEHEL